MQRRTLKTAIPPKIREEVEKRDNYRCVFCQTTDGVRGEAHFIRRSQGGLGIPKNLLTVCRHCHREFDDGKYADLYRERAREYLMSIYPDWDEKDLVYKKYS